MKELQRWSRRSAGGGMRAVMNRSSSPTANSQAHCSTTKHSYKNARSGTRTSSSWSRMLRNLSKGDEGRPVSDCSLRHLILLSAPAFIFRDVTNPFSAYRSIALHKRGKVSSPRPGRYQGSRLHCSIFTLVFLSFTCVPSYYALESHWMASSC